eukprot:TRINITY_DN1865_c0_g1_i15.p1 TRINITY_DN1865_c0_g1~~TRINITY_DN1865_c0_g1_i15.p1  ORF type:complete len:1025 (+),score=268.14 TRINITY_DN1865_c0_g1_i15:306-3077(+)
MSFWSEGKVLIIASGRLLTVFNSYTTEIITTLNHHDSPIVDIDVSLDLNLLFSLDSSKIIQVCDLETYSVVQTVFDKTTLVPEDQISRIKYDQVTSSLLTNSSTPLKWSFVEATKRSSTVRFMTTVKTNPSVLITATETHITIYNIQDSKEIISFEHAHDPRSLTVLVSIGEGRIVSGDMFGNLKVFEFETGRCIRKYCLQVAAAQDSMSFSSKTHYLEDLRVEASKHKKKSNNKNGHSKTKSEKSVNILSVIVRTDKLLLVLAQHDENALFVHKLGDDGFIKSEKLGLASPVPSRSISPNCTVNEMNGESQALNQNGNGTNTDTKRGKRMMKDTTSITSSTLKNSQTILKASRPSTSHRNQLPNLVPPPPSSPSRLNSARKRDLAGSLLIKLGSSNKRLLTARRLDNKMDQNFHQYATSVRPEFRRRSHSQSNIRRPPTAKVLSSTIPSRPETPTVRGLNKTSRPIRRPQYLRSASSPRHNNNNFRKASPTTTIRSSSSSHSASSSYPSPSCGSSPPLISSSSSALSSPSPTSTHFKSNQSFSYLSEISKVEWLSSVSFVYVVRGVLKNMQIETGRNKVLLKLYDDDNNNKDTMDGNITRDMVAIARMESMREKQKVIALTAISEQQLLVWLPTEVLLLDLKESKILWRNDDIFKHNNDNNDNGNLNGGDDDDVTLTTVTHLSLPNPDQNGTDKSSSNRIIIGAGFSNGNINLLSFSIDSSLLNLVASYETSDVSISTLKLILMENEMKMKSVHEKEIIIEETVKKEEKNVKESNDNEKNKEENNNNNNNNNSGDENNEELIEAKKNISHLEIINSNNIRIYFTSSNGSFGSVLGSGEVRTVLEPALKNKRKKQVKPLKVDESNYNLTMEDEKNDYDNRLNFVPITQMKDCHEIMHQAIHSNRKWKGKRKVQMSSQGSNLNL